MAAPQLILEQERLMCSFEQAVIAFLVEGTKLTCIRECLLKVSAAVTVDMSTV